MHWMDPYFVPEPTEPVVDDRTGQLNDVKSTIGSWPASAIVFTGVTPFVSVSGIADGDLRPGRRVHLIAQGGPIVIQEESGLSRPRNRIVTGEGNLEVAQGKAVFLVWSTISERWHVAIGSNGLLGPGGADGLSVYSGAGAPSSGLGVDGETYVDVASGDVYRKSAGAWSIVGNIQGVDGAPGADGKTIRSGAGAPSSGLGVNGDFYLNTSNYDLYGPKAAGAWGSPTSLLGTVGSNGKSVLSGSGAPSSGLGTDGDFYIDTTAHAIYGPKTSGAWGSSTSLVGPAGTNGTNGSNGTNGNSVLNGTGVPSSGLGVNGDFYIDTSAYNIYGPKAAGAWPSGVSLIGATSPVLLADYSLSAQMTLSSPAGSNFTIGVLFHVLVAGKTCTGVRFYWGVGSKTVKVSLWDAANTRLATVNVNTTAAGIYTATWAGVALTQGAAYRISCWQTDGANISKSTTISGVVPARPFQVSKFGYVIQAADRFHAGDAHPDTVSGTDLYLMDPTIA